MNAVIDTRVSPQMRARLLANRRGKLHSDQWREVVTEPLITALVLMVPAIILLRSFLVTLFVGGLWMLGAGALLVGGILLFFRARRYRRIRVHFGVFRAPDKLPSTWGFWKPVVLTTPNGTFLPFKHSLASDKRFKANQEYLVYYLKSADAKTFTLLSFAPTDHLDTSIWQPLTKGQ
ncbi:MAG: hypothetical protein H0X30_37535 [Anaerolineae bacterium]|nr:hypothetical protein [Anaerolineae bacterium]